MTHFLTFEAGEKAGKTTQLRRLEKQLTSDGYRVKVFREPGGTDMGEDIRLLIKDKKKYPEADNFVIACLFAAQRRLNMNAYIKDVNEFFIGNQFDFILADRWYDSTRVYQIATLASTRREKNVIRTMNNLATYDIIPNRTYILDGRPEILQLRGRDEEFIEDRFDELDMTFHNSVRKAYLSLEKKNPSLYEVINAEQDIDKVFDDIYSSVQKIKKK